MASTVSEKWGAKEALGTANPPYPYIDFKWETSHEVLTSPLFDFPIKGNVITFMINTEAVDTATSATMTFKLLGAANPEGTFAEIYAPTAIANADFDVTSTTSYPYMKISMDPSANIAPEKVIRVGVLVDKKL